jgi:hypothetical protein
MPDLVYVKDVSPEQIRVAIICRKRDENTEFNQKNATKRVFFHGKM